MNNQTNTVYLDCNFGPLKKYRPYNQIGVGRDHVIIRNNGRILYVPEAFVIDQWELARKLQDNDDED